MTILESLTWAFYHANILSCYPVGLSLASNYKKIVLPVFNQMRNKIFLCRIARRHDKVLGFGFGLELGLVFKSKPELVASTPSYFSPNTSRITQPNASGSIFQAFFSLP